MNDLLIFIWTILIFASVAWYTFLLYYIGVKGGMEIVQMAKNLKARNEGEKLDDGG